jgi:hypothetical protein
MQHVWLGYYMDCEKIAQISWLVREDAFVGNRENFCVGCNNQLSASARDSRIGVTCLNFKAFCDSTSSRIQNEL